MKKLSQKDNILNHMQKYGFITPLDAIKDYHCLRLASIIFILKEEGQCIITQIIHYKNNEGRNVKYAQYSLV